MKRRNDPPPRLQLGDRAVTKTGLLVKIVHAYTAADGEREYWVRTEDGRKWRMSADTLRKVN